MKCGGAGLAAFWSLSVVAGHGSQSTVRFLIEFSENLACLTALFALGLLYPRLWDRRVPVHVYQLVFLLAAFYTFYISLFAVRTLFPSGLGAALFRMQSPSLVLLLPIGVAYVFCHPATSRSRPQLRL